jgi:tubulin delta
VRQVPNEALHHTCQKLHNVMRPSFDDLNRVAARALASVLLPTTHATSSSTSAAGLEGELGRSTTLLGDVVQHLCAHPRHRVLSLRSVPQMPATSVDFTVLQWPGLLKRLRQMQISGECA